MLGHYRPGSEGNLASDNENTPLDNSTPPQEQSAPEKPAEQPARLGDAGAAHEELAIGAIGGGERGVGVAARGGAPLGERRRIQHHDVEPRALRLELAQELEGVRLADPERFDLLLDSEPGDQGGATQEMPARADAPTVEQPQLHRSAFEESPTVEMPGYEADSTLMQKLDAAGRQAPSAAEPTAM